jgi:nicotinate phosphoribosyltransferase
MRLAQAAQAEALLQPVFQDGKRIVQPQPIDEVRRHALNQIASLPEEYKRLRNPQIYNVLLSPVIGALKEQMLANPDPA